MKRFWTSLVSVAVFVGVGIAAPPPHAAASESSFDNVVADTPVDYTPHVLDGIVFSIAEVGDVMVLGGSFTEVQASNGGPVLERNGVVAFNRNNGQISTDFTPQFNSTVRSVVPAGDGESVFIGGQFGQMDGESVPKVVRVSSETGNRITSFAPGPIDAAVHDMNLVEDRLFIGGTFTSIDGVNRSHLAELDPGTGQLRDSMDLLFEGTHLGGWTFAHKFDVSPDGNTMVVTGNFTSVEGLERSQVAVLDISGSSAVVTNWQTDRWQPNCYASFAYYLNDLDFSPDGSYFVLGSMGGYGSGPPSLCDSVSKWTLDQGGSGVDPVWVDYTGGDSVYALEATGDVVYYGGHSRWMNNPFAADRVGPGAVDREGIGALHALNGLPIDWNPGRDRGRGVFDMLATSEGLWVGSDTERIARYLYRARIAMFPLVDGNAIPTASAPELPVDVIQTGIRNGPEDSRYLYRINAGGPTMPSLDAGPEWIPDDAAPGSDYRNTGNTATSNGVTSVTDSVPATTPLGVYMSERWDASGSPEMGWTFPVEAGTNVQVRLYMADTCSCTQEPGSRVFSILVEDQMAFEDVDLNASVGHQVGTMLSRDVVSDGSVNIEFLHGMENPTVNAIEIVDLDAPTPDPQEVDQAQERFFDGEVGSAPEPVSLTGDVPWDSVKGGFIADDSLYLAMVSGELHRRPLNGDQIGEATALDLHGLTGFAAEIQRMTGLFYSNGRIYFTLAGQSDLFMRYFELDSGIVGAQRFAVSDPADVVDWGTARGMFLAGDTVYWATADDNLHAIGWDEGIGDGTVAGTPEVVSGPAQDGSQWASRTLIAMPGTAPPPPNEAPEASFTDQCTGLECSFDGTASSDPDGSVDSYAWSVEGEAGGSEATLDYTFAEPGTYPVTLTVTDDDGDSDSTTRDVVVESAPNQPPTATFTDTCTGLECAFDAAESSDPDGSIVSYAWSSSDGGTGDQSAYNHTFTADGTYDVTLAVTDNDGTSTELVREIVVTSDPVPVNELPVAEFVDSCEFLSCTFDASASSDPDGSIAGYVWTIDGVEAAQGEVFTQSFAAAGMYSVGLTVTDDGGETASVSRDVAVQADPGPEPSGSVAFVASAAGPSDGSNRSHQMTIPSAVQAGDVMVAVFSTNSVASQVMVPSGWEVAAQAETRSMAGSLFYRVATASDAGSVLTVNTDRWARGSVVVSVYRGAEVTGASLALEPETISRAEHTTPVLDAVAGDWVISYWADKTASTTEWDPPASQTVRQTGAGPGGGHLSWLLADSDGPVAGPTAGGLTATANSSTSNALVGTVVIKPTTDV